MTESNYLNNVIYFPKMIYLENIYVLYNKCKRKSFENENSSFPCNYLDGNEKLTTYSR